MSTTRTYEIITTETENIASNADFLKSIETLKKMLHEKLNKLSSSLRGAKAFVKGNTIFIKDTYGTIENLEQELSAFGFAIENVSGNLYKASDRTVGLLGIMDENSLQDVCAGTLKIDQSLAQVVKNLSGIKLPEIEKLKQNATLAKILETLREGQSYSASDKVIKEGKEYAGDYKNFVRKQETEHVVSRESNIKESQQAFAELNQIISAINNGHKQDMVNGIETLITNRAKAMGFTVKQQAVGDQIRLTLEKGV